MAKRIVGKLRPVRYVVQDNMLFNCIPFIYITRKVFNTIDEAREYVGKPCDEYLFSSIDKAEEAILKVDKSKRITILYE